MINAEISYIDNVKIQKTDALLVVDAQNDFMPGGALAVPSGDEIVNETNELMRSFFLKGSKVILTQDWHPLSHGSFASKYEDKEPYDTFTEKKGLGPILWPDHCVQGTEGAAIHKNININNTHLLLRKGYHKQVDSYSAFLENDKETETGLDGYLKSTGISRVFICGLALDYCVFFSAQDAIHKNYKVFIIIDLTRGIDSPPGNNSKAISAMNKSGVQFVRFKDIS